MPKLEATLRPVRKTDAAGLAALIDIAGEDMPSHMWSRMAEAGQTPFEVGRAPVVEFPGCARGGDRVLMTRPI
jgi:hypothetical protein